MDKLSAGEGREDEELDRVRPMNEAGREEQLSAISNTEDCEEDIELEEDREGETGRDAEEYITSWPMSNLWPEVRVTVGLDNDSLGGVQPFPGPTVVSDRIGAGEREVTDPGVNI